MKTVARAVAVGAVAAFVMASAPAALAGPTPGDINVPCGDTALADAIAGAVGGETLSLATFCTYKLAEALPVITVNLTIQDNGAVIERSYAQGTPDFSIFTVTSGADVVLDHPNLRNGDSAAVGNTPPIYDSGYGGAIYNEDGTVTVNGGYFNDNSSAYNGGDIDNEASLTVSGALFTGETGPDSYGSFNGGAIFNEGNATVTHSTFTGNSAYYGGAIYVNYRASSMNVVDCEFVANTAVDTGGGVYNLHDGLMMAGTTFRHNQATNGGGLYSQGSATVTRGTFTDNTAEFFGGGWDSEGLGHATVNGSDFTRNTAEFGGGLYSLEPLTVNGGGFTGNTAEFYGGGFDNFNAATVNGAFFRNNHAQLGGAIYNFSYNPLGLSVSDSRIIHNSAILKGGGIYNAQILTLTSTVVAGNRPDNCWPVGSVPGCFS